VRGAEYHAWTRRRAGRARRSSQHAAGADHSGFSRRHLNIRPRGESKLKMPAARGDLGDTPAAAAAADAAEGRNRRRLPVSATGVGSARKNPHVGVPIFGRLIGLDANADDYEVLYFFFRILCPDWKFCRRFQSLFYGDGARTPSNDYSIAKPNARA
jgi:hypothetical protein